MNFQGRAMVNTSWVSPWRARVVVPRVAKSSTLVAYGPCFGVDSSKIHEVTGLRSNLKRIAWLCLLLTFESALMFAWHQHSSKTEAAKCTVCVAAHSAAPKATVKLPNTTFVQVVTFRAESVAAKQTL
jgi:hypothetical protein